MKIAKASLPPFCHNGHCSVDELTFLPVGESADDVGTNPTFPSFKEIKLLGVHLICKYKQYIFLSRRYLDFHGGKFHDILYLYLGRMDKKFDHYIV